MTLVTQKEAEDMARSVADLIGRPAAMAIILTTDDHGIPTHEYCPKGMVDTLYGPQIKAEIARVVSAVTVNLGGKG